MYQSFSIDVLLPCDHIFLRWNHHFLYDRLHLFLLLLVVPVIISSEKGARSAEKIPIHNQFRNKICVTIWTYLFFKHRKFYTIATIQFS